MPRYFFHLYNDLDVPDEEGAELPDLQAAEEYARENILVTAAEMLKENGRITLSHRIEIEDQDGGVLSTLMFSDVVTVES